MQAFDLAEPAFTFGFGDACGEVVADLDESVALGGVGPQQRAADAGMFVDAGGAERTAAGAGGDLPTLEVAEELGPFLVGRGAIFLAGSQCAPPGQERQMGLDGFLRVDGLVAQGDVDVAVSGDDLGDVRGQPVEDSVGDEAAGSRAA